MSVTSVSTDIDFEKEGKQSSYLQVPHSRNDSAWGKLHIPIVVIKNGEGPTILFTGGLHGGEYEGPVALMKLSRQLTGQEIQGRLILIPALNLPAVVSGQRLSPIDQKDMNRIFPGDPRGTISEIIAHYVSETLVPICDAVIDLHSGGTSLNLMPYISMHYLDDPEQSKKTLAALKAFQAPVALMIQEIGGEGLLDYYVEQQGKIFLCAELGGMGTLSTYTVQIAETGIDNLLKHFGLIEGDVLSRTNQGLPETQFMQVPGEEYYCSAPARGIYETFFEVGELVEEGQAVGQVHFPQHLEWTPYQVIVQRSGVLLGRLGPGWVNVGDCVAVLAQHVEKL